MSYKQQRNEKILGEGLSQYEPTNQYAQYLEDAEDRYTQQGKLAMEDTMGKAAALTGGYGNSYAQTLETSQRTSSAHTGKTRSLNSFVMLLWIVYHDPAELSTQTHSGPMQRKVSANAKIKVLCRHKVFQAEGMQSEKNMV